MKTIEVWPNQIYQRGEFRKLSLGQKLANLQALGVTSVLNVSPNTDSELAAVLHPNYWHLPIPDSANADLSQVESLAAWAVNFCRTGGRVLVHCHAGRNRSSLLSAILLMELHGLTGQQAVDHMRRVRPNALATEAFTDYLLQRPPNLFNQSQGVKQ